MIDQSLGPNYSRVVNVLIFIFPIVIISLQVAGDIVLFILAMMGIYIAISKKLSPFIIKEIQVFSYLTIGYFTAVCLSVLFSGQATELAHYIPRDFYFLFAPFIALAFYKAEINLNYLLTGIKFALLILGIIIVMENDFFNWGHFTRNCGVMNCGVFGNLAVVLFFIVLVFFQHEPSKHKVFTLLSLLSGLFIIIVSGTRGAWLTALLLLGVNLYFIYRRKIGLRSKIIVTVIIVIIISLAGTNQFVKGRGYSAYIGISKWMSEDDARTSPGLRLTMYSKAIDSIKDVPFFGHGYRTSNVVLFQNDSSRTSKEIVNFNHLHNAYLTNYYNGGVVLLGALLLLLFVPLKIFIRANSQNRENPVFTSGVFLTLGYVSFGMVNILLGDTYMNGFYVFFLAIFLLLTNKLKTVIEA